MCKGELCEVIMRADLRGSDLACFKTLLHYWPGGIEENHESFLSGRPCVQAEIWTRKLSGQEAGWAPEPCLAHMSSHCSDSKVIFFFVSWGGVDWVHLVRRPLIGLLYQPRMIDEYWVFGGIKIGRGNLSIQRKPAPVPFCSPQIPHDLTWYRTWSATVGSRRLAT
jgi:hypothetical protein